jgi:anti-anti-sigma factor
MSRYQHDDHEKDSGTPTEIALSPTGRGKSWEIRPDGGSSPRLRVQSIERTAIVRLLDAEIFFEEEAVHAVSRQLHRLIQAEGHTRLVVNFAGVHYVSSEVLGILAGLQKEVDPIRGSIVLCGLDPLLRDMVRITHLDRVFDVCGDEAEALGLILR